MNGKIAPSVMCVDFMNLPATLDAFQKLSIEYLHVDIMDGCFVPNYTLGPDFCRALKDATPIPLDIHLMITEPERKLDWFPFGQGDYVSIHYEATAHPIRALQAIRRRGGKSMLALNPATPIQVLETALDDMDGLLIMTVNPGYAGQALIPRTLDKIRAARKFLDERGASHIEIEVDGNVSFENAAKMRAAGADIFVAGSSSVFKKDASLEHNTALLRQAIR